MKDFKEVIDEFKEVRTYQGKTLPPGQVTEVCVPIPPGTTNVEISNFEGKCGCGGNLIPSKTEKMTWVCDRDNWWRFWSRKHAKLHVELERLPTPLGNA